MLEKTKREDFESEFVPKSTSEVRKVALIVQKVSKIYKNFSKNVHSGPKIDL